MDPQSETPGGSAAPSGDASDKAAEARLALFGGFDVDVEYIAGPGEEPRKEAVTVLLLPLDRMERMLTASGNDAALVELYCDKPAGWTHTLTPASQIALWAKGEEINRGNFGAWYQTWMKKMEVLRPGIFGKLETMIQELLKKGPFPNLSPTSSSARDSAAPSS